MRIKRNEKIFGIPVVQIRDFFEKNRDFGFTKIELERYFALSKKSTNSLIKELIQNDFIEKMVENIHHNDYQLTNKGQTLCAARSIPPMNKKKADKIFNEFMRRVEEINDNDYYLCKVEKILLFGSYLNSENIDYGDIDIAFELKRKIDNYDEFEKARKKRIRELRQNGKRFSDFMDEIFYPEKEVILKLKNKCQYISLHQIEIDGKLETAKYKQVYPVQE